MWRLLASLPPRSRLLVTRVFARFGLNEAAARDKGIAHHVWSCPFRDVDRAVVEREEEGFLKVLTARDADRILGVTIVGERAGDLVHELVLAMKNGLGLRRVAETIHAYPTFAEAARKAADRAQKARLTPLAARLLSGLYRWRRR